MTYTALLGGSFNPAHGGHRSISLFAMKALHLDEVLWLVSPGNPLKSSKNMAPLTARLASAKNMSKNRPIYATAIEAQFGTRYTIDTLRELKRKFPKRRFVWIMGADNMAQFHHWYKWREIASLMPIIVVERPTYNDKARLAPSMGYLRKYVRRAGSHLVLKHNRTPTVVFLRFRPDKRSATDIRSANPNWHDLYDDRSVWDAISRKKHV